jgi:hypothetical protein
MVSAAGVLAGVLALAVVGLAVASARRIGARRGSSDSAAARLESVLRVARPEIGEGIRAAVGGRGWPLVVGAGGISVGVFVTIVVFAASLSSLLATPPAYGWPWDVAVLANAGYGPMRLDEVEATLDGRGGADGWTALGFSSSLTVDGEPVFSMMWADGGSDEALTVAAGDLPADDDEVALGVRTAAERGVEVGDTVTVGGGLAGDTRSAEVTGLVVFPAVGPLGSDRGSPGVGALVTVEMAEDLALPIELGFLGIDLDDSSRAAEVLDALAASSAAIDPDGEGLIPYDRPIRPPEIDDARSMRTLPIVVAGLVALAVAVGLWFSIAVSVRSRRRELAILRSVGFTGRQVRWSVRAQTLATMVVGLVIGLPLGVIVGRLTWRAFADRLGVVPDPAVPLLWLGLTVVGALVLALLAAAFPARRAAATRAADGLRSE